MGKRIVICADGTGNRGGVTRGTNVYRIANAVDIWSHEGAGDKQQVVYYQDGVGTDNAKILKAVGGAFGYGLSSNVRQLYDFLVRNYEDGDEIYLFGFSRGAYTVRVFARMVTACGLIDKEHYRSADGLWKLVKMAYKAHRKSQKAEPHEWQAQRAKRETPADRFKAKYGREMPSNSERFPERDYGPRDVPIKLIGVWDTVGAVGLPFEELTDALDVLTGLKIRNTELSPLVEKAFHALAIDEERQTFLPVLWTEHTKKSWQTIEQVWFAGVHSNVGGGTPKDQLAHVSLQWMIERVEAETELRFLDVKKKSYLAAANPNGRMYDSRSGVKMYYRYRPRNVRVLSESKLAKGDRPRVHASVFERISRGTANYAPSALSDYQVRGKKIYLSGVFDPENEPDENRRCLELARDVVWWRRCAYYAFLGVTLLFVTGIVRLSKRHVDCEVGWPFFGWIFDLARWLTPEFAAGPADTLRNHPFYLLLYLLIGVAVLYLHRLLERGIRSPALAGWKSVLGEAWEKPRERIWHKIARRIRRSNRIGAGVVFFKSRFLPKVLAAGLPILVIGGLVWYGQTAWSDVSGRPSQQSYGPTIEPVVAGTPSVIGAFDTKTPCFKTNLRLEAGLTYAFDVEVLTPWVDNGHPASPSGLTGEPSLLMKLHTPFKRSKKDEYLTLMGGISCTEGQTFKIGDGSTIKAEATGPLYLFVNDAACYYCYGGAWSYYENNEGTANITVRNLGSAADG